MLFLLLAGCNTEETGGEQEKKFTNPVYEPVLADPSILKAEDDYYYAYGTEDAWGEDSDTKLIPIVRSKNLIDWEFVGEALEKKPDWKGNGSLWAPDIHYYKENYYLYYSLSTWGDSNPGIGIAISETPEGPFKDKGALFTSSEIGVENSIDPFFYVENETPYLIWGSFHGIYGVPLTEDGLSVDGEPFRLAGTDYEAPYIIKRNSYYYFFGSRGSCCEGASSTYHVAVGRSESLKGPYRDKAGNTLLDNGGTTILEAGSNSRFAGPGHNAVITDEAGQDWLVYHAIEKEDPYLWTSASRRPLMLDKLQWKDDWPKLSGIEPGEEPQEVPVTE